jgi:hypothetical protein
VGLRPTLSFGSKKLMNQYEYQVDMRLNGEYYCRIYQYGIPGAIALTDDYDTEQEAIEAAKAIIREYQAMTGANY